MNTYLENQYYHAYDKLREISYRIDPWYDVDKVKSYAVYIWTKGDEGENVFDIEPNTITFYTNHEIIPEALPAIHDIQDALKEVEKISKQLRKEV